jgi:MerR family mercuric resistance operon transcriptional regulator
MQDYTIGSLANAAGVGVETIRYYQRRGLLDTPAAGNGMRRYSSGHLARLRFIRRAQTLGFTLEQAAELLTVDEMEDRVAAREAARRKLGEIEARLLRLEAMRNALADLVRCCEDTGGSQPCPILQTLAGDEDA